MDVMRPAAYSKAHWSGPRRERTSRSARSLEGVHRFDDNHGTGALGHGISGRPESAPPTHRLPFSAAAAARGTNAWIEQRTCPGDP